MGLPVPWLPPAPPGPRPTSGQGCPCAAGGRDWSRARGGSRSSMGLSQKWPVGIIAEPVVSIRQQSRDSLPHAHASPPSLRCRADTAALASQSFAFPGPRPVRSSTAWRRRGPSHAMRPSDACGIRHGGSVGSCPGVVVSRTRERDRRGHGGAAGAWGTGGRARRSRRAGERAGLPAGGARRVCPSRL